MIDAPLAYAFGVGMVATVNPCGFAMLPAYIAFFLGSDTADGDARTSTSRSLAVGLSVSAGFITVFSAVGLAIYHLSASVERWTPWATIAIGGVLALLGLAMIRGFEPALRVPRLQKGGRDRTGASMFLFGVSYAVTSITCSLPLFTAAVVGTFRRENALSSLATFVSYALGMTLVLLALTVTMGMARRTLLKRIRQALPYVNRASGVLLVVAGGYLVHYGWYERRVQAGDGSGSAAVSWVTDLSSDISEWVRQFGPTRLGLLLALGLVGVLTATFGLKARR